MRLDAGYVWQTGQPRRRAALQLFLEMFPLVINLALRDGNWIGWMAWRNFLYVELIAAPARFGMNGAKIRRNNFKRGGCGTEAGELRMMGIAPRPASKNRLRQERFPPKCNEAAGVQIFRVQRPQTHVFVLVFVTAPAERSCAKIPPASDGNPA
jgi:hypothetical protein